MAGGTQIAFTQNKPVNIRKGTHLKISNCCLERFSNSTCAGQLYHKATRVLQRIGRLLQKTRRLLLKVLCFVLEIQQSSRNCVQNFASFLTLKGQLSQICDVYTHLVNLTFWQNSKVLILISL